MPTLGRERHRAGPDRATSGGVVPRAGPAAARAAAIVVIVLAGVGGYLGHRALTPKPVAPEPLLEDYPLIKNLRLYRNVEDVEYLKKLDSPELFGDEGE